MKKTFLALISLSLLCAAVFAEDMASDAATKAELAAQTKFLLKNLKKNKEKIQKIALELPYQERLALYNKEKAEPFAPVAINIFSPLIGIPPNLGIGSFMQHDVAGGLIHLGTGFVGTSCIVGAFLTTIYARQNEVALSLFIAGGALSLGSWVFGIVRPITYVSKYNKRLEEALLLNETKMSIVPLVIPNGQMGLAVSIQY